MTIHNNTEFSLSAEFLLALGGNVWKGKYNNEQTTTNKVDLISLNKDVPKPSCLQNMEDITFKTKFAAGTGTSLGKSGLLPI